MRFGRACLVVLALAFGFALGCTHAHAAIIDDAIAHFAADDFDETLTGIGQVVASGSPRAEVIIGALQNGQLMFSAEQKKVYIQDADGK
ncbi:MAG: urea ABC transporter permease subunit UrtB, partial [Xanthobacteraceae bacterium]